jgi:hypothetical protein
VIYVLVGLLLSVKIKGIVSGIWKRTPCPLKGKPPCSGGKRKTVGEKIERVLCLDGLMMKKYYKNGDW